MCVADENDYTLERCQDKYLINPLVPRDDFSWCSVMLRKPNVTPQSEAKNTPSNGWPFKSPVFCTVPWALNSCAKELRQSKIVADGCLLIFESIIVQITYYKYLSYP
jgi:hypothetical protein